MELMLVLSWVALRLAMKEAFCLSEALDRISKGDRIWLLVLFLLVRRAYCSINVCVYAIKEMGTECLTGTAPVRLLLCSRSEEEWCSQITICLLSTLRTPLHLGCRCCPLHPWPSSLSVWGTDWRVWFPPCLASVMYLPLLSITCVLRLWC